MPKGEYERQHIKYKPPLEPEFADVRLKNNTVKRLRYFSTMDNESYDDILNKMMDVMDGTKRRSSVAEGKAWLRSSSAEYRKLRNGDNYDNLDD
jgi:hypothetical protein